MTGPCPQRAQRVLVTGASGFLGQGLISQLAQHGDCEAVIAVDVREVPAGQRLPGITYLTQDVRDPTLAETVAAHRIDTLVHLAAIVTPGKDANRAFEYSVDVEGTRNVLQACVAHGVQHIVVSSSGAAYGYHADNAEWLTEDMPLRGNESFAYSHHKRLVEEMLAQHRQTHPQLQQTVLRIGTILGERVNNQITALFEKPRLLAIQGSAALWSPKVVRAAMGAHFALDLFEGMNADELAALQVPLLVTSSHEGQFLHTQPLPWPCAWVFGHEGQGVAPSLMARAARSVRIIQPGGEESLNVASAAAICLHASAVSAIGQDAAS